MIRRCLGRAVVMLAPAHRTFGSKADAVEWLPARALDQRDRSDVPPLGDQRPVLLDRPLAARDIDGTAHLELAHRRHQRGLDQMVDPRSREHDQRQRQHIACDPVPPARAGQALASAHRHQHGNPCQAERQQAPHHQRDHDDPQPVHPRRHPFPGVQRPKHALQPGLGGVVYRRQTGSFGVDIGGQPIVARKFQLPHRQQAVDPRVVGIEFGLEPCRGDRPVSCEVVPGEEFGLRPVTASDFEPVSGAEIAPFRAVSRRGDLPQHSAAGRGDGLHRYRPGDALFCKGLRNRPRPFERDHGRRRHERRLLRAEQHHGDMGEARKAPHQEADPADQSQPLVLGI